MIDSIRKFNELAGNTTDEFNVRQIAMYTGLQCEELAEKLSSLGLYVMSAKLDELGLEFKRGIHDACFRGADRHALMDDDVDLFVVTVGSLLSQGVDIDGAINEVNRANMSKAWPDGAMRRDSNGKIIKPEGWTAPDLGPFICGGRHD